MQAAAATGVQQMPVVRDGDRGHHGGLSTAGAPVSVVLGCVIIINVLYLRMILIACCKKNKTFSERVGVDIMYVCT